MILSSKMPMPPYLWRVLCQAYKWEILIISDFQQSIEYKLISGVNSTQMAKLAALIWAFKLTQNKKDDLTQLANIFSELYMILLSYRNKEGSEQPQGYHQKLNQLVSLWASLTKEWSIVKIMAHNNSQTFKFMETPCLTNMISPSFQENSPLITCILPIAQSPLQTEIYLQTLGHISF